MKNPLWFGKVLMTILTLGVICSCASTHPNPQQSAWPEYSTRYRLGVLRYRIPNSEAERVCPLYFDSIPDEPWKRWFSKVFRQQFDWQDDLPRLVIEMELERLPGLEGKDSTIPALKRFTEEGFSGPHPPNSLYGEASKVQLDVRTVRGVSWVRVEALQDKRKSKRILEMWRRPLYSDVNLAVTAQYHALHDREWLKSRQALFHEFIRTIEVLPAGAK